MIEKNWKEIIKPSKLEIVEDTYTDTYGRFNAQPLERGFGVTIGNSLRTDTAVLHLRLCHHWGEVRRKRRRSP